ncbi:MAG: segregation/condensation protein A [Firmicutes bacterium]|nr:segregation/condensation protein A [Bacillota bacterium]
MEFIRASDQYKVTLSDFEGPLDLLLHLIRDAKLDIKTVPLCKVTGQYLEFLNQLDTLDLNLASEFIEVGATLVEIKTKQILPKFKEEENVEEDAEARLRAQLEEYRILKEASEKLKLQENINRFYKDPEPMKEVIKYRLDNLDLDLLTGAFLRILHKIEQKAAPVKEKSIVRDRFTVAEKITDIRNRLVSGKQFIFSSLFDADITKSEIINTFLAMLELLKGGEIKVTQGDRFTEITIIKGENLNKNDSESFSTYDTIEEDKSGGEIEYEIVQGIND